MKTTKNLWIRSGVLTTAFCIFIAGELFSQTASYDQNQSNGGIGVSGTNNTAFGVGALNVSGTGGNNSAVGWGSLGSNQNGYLNTGVGYAALFQNSTGYENSAVGSGALYSNTSGIYNSAFGSNSMYDNTTGAANTAVGYLSLYSHTSGSHNTAGGYGSLRLTTSGWRNTAFGGHSLDGNTTGYANTAIGMYSMMSNQTGFQLTGIGYSTDVTIDGLSNSSCFGFGATVGQNNKIRIGNGAVTTIEGNCAFTWPSDARFKFNVTEEVKGLEFIKALRPVVYNFDGKKYEEFVTRDLPEDVKKIHLDQDFSEITAIRQSGFIAQEVEQAAKNSGYNFDGVHVPKNSKEYYSVSYSQFVVPLVKAVQEQQNIIENQARMLKELSEKIANMELTTGGLGNQSNLNFLLGQNIPNPFTKETTVNVQIPKASKSASIIISDLNGKIIKKSIIDNHENASIVINTDGLEPGIYIYSLYCDGVVLDSKKMMVGEN